MCYNVPLYFERKNIKISDIFYLTRQNPHTIITFSSGESIATTIPIKELMLYLPEEDFLNISKGVVLRKNQIVHISDEGLYTMTDGAVFQGRKQEGTATLPVLNLSHLVFTISPLSNFTLISLLKLYSITSAIIPFFICFRKFNL